MGCEPSRPCSIPKSSGVNAVRLGATCRVVTQRTHNGGGFAEYALHEKGRVKVSSRHWLSAPVLLGDHAGEVEVGCNAERGLQSGLARRFAPIAASAVMLAACSNVLSTPTPSTTSGPCAQGDLFNPVNFHPCWLAANVNAGGAPVYGGTLKIEGDEDVTAYLDPQGEYGPVGVERAITRQLVSYPASTHLVRAETIVPDAATGMPTVSADGLTYTFHIKSGVMWNTPTPRQVTSQDFKRGIERTCDPTLAGYGNPGYYTATIQGFLSFCSKFEGMDAASSPAARAAYINGHDEDVSGIQTPDSSTIVFTLTQPATDFLNILAFPFASAAPVEDLSYVPVRPGNPVYSDGPYQVLKYIVGHEIDLDHNPDWHQSTDAIRHDYVSNIDVKLDPPGSEVAARVQDELVAGATDLEWNTRVPPDRVAGLTSPSWNPQYGVFPAPGESGPFVRFNVYSPNNNGALANPKVRQALEYAIDKVAINEIFGGPSLNEPLNQVIGPGAEGYVQFNDYPTKDNKGDPGKCKTLLRQAGVSNLTLKDLYKAYLPIANEVFKAEQSDFAKCGVTVVGIPITPNLDTFGTADILKEGKWDFTHSTGWGPDWFGPRNGRAILPDLFDGALNFPNGPDLGGYDNPLVDDLVNKAESALTLRQATSYWHKADELVMADAAFIPTQTSLIPLFRSRRVHNAIYTPGNGYDITQVWLSP
jgi:ABC-type transport system substrate-binding protein